MQHGLYLKDTSRVLNINALLIKDLKKHIFDKISRLNLSLDL